MMTWIQALMNPSAYPHPVRGVRHLQTHISHVFLTGPFAYKIKKPLDLNFLDYSTLEKRRTYCIRELELNRRLAPEIYLGVVPIIRDGADFRMGLENEKEGKGEIVEYAVKMAEFDQAGLLDAMAGRGELTREHILQLAGQVAQFHLSAERADTFGSPEGVGGYVLGNFDQTEKYRGIAIPHERFVKLKTYSERLLTERPELFQRRIQRGAIRVCHGDLHLQNICLHRDRLVIFDCIEFNDSLNHIDAISEVAFLLMDLHHRGFPGLANRFLNAYLEGTQDYEGLSVLDFYLAYRAYVRGKVACLLLDEPEVSEGEKGTARERASAYFELAERYLVPGHPRLILTAGVSGSGKSTVAADLAEGMGGIIIRSDAVRKSLSGIRPWEAESHREDTEYREGMYAPGMTEKTYAGMLERAGSVVESGRCAILDATFSRKRHRQEARVWAGERGIPFGLVHCTAQASVLEERLARRTAAGTDLSDAGVEIMRRQMKDFEPFDDSESRLAVRVRTDEAWDPESIREALLQGTGLPGVFQKSSKK